MADRNQQDQKWMAAALGLAKRGVGNVAPNPAVGCIIVRDQQIVGRGWTMPGGRPHAEAVALAEAGENAVGATAYVTLEPCAHHGQTPPCAEALVTAGVSRVVSALTDPDPRVDGGGHDILRSAGIEVVEGVLEDRARALNAGFLKLVSEGRPYVTVKIAGSIDSRVATESGESKWITGGEARIFGHKLRARSDAILVGIGTVLADDPSLTCRIPGLERFSPTRIILDGGLRTPMDRALITSAKTQPTWILCLPGGDKSRSEELEASGVRVIEGRVNSEGRIDLENALSRLASEGVTRVLIEGGPTLVTSAIKHNLADEILFFRAPSILGEEGVPAIAALGLERLADAKRYKLAEIRKLGEDLVETYRFGA